MKIQSLYKDKTNLLIVFMFAEIIMGSIASILAVGVWTESQEALAQQDLRRIIAGVNSATKSTIEMTERARTDPNSTIIPNSYIVLYKNGTETRSELVKDVNEIVSENKEDVKVPYMYKALKAK